MKHKHSIACGQGKAQVELLPPESALDKLADLVADRLARPPQAPAGKPLAELSEEVLMEPWYLPRETAYAILRLLPISHQRKWSYFFEDYGCLRCGSKKVPHSSNGFCGRCHVGVHMKLKTSIKRRATEGEAGVQRQVEQIMSRVNDAQRILAGKGAHDESCTLLPGQHRAAIPGDATRGTTRLLPAQGVGSRRRVCGHSHRRKG